MDKNVHYKNPVGLVIIFGLLGVDNPKLVVFEDESMGRYIETKEGKLIAKNTNRSRKKAARREGKKAIKNGWIRCGMMLLTILTSMIIDYVIYNNKL